MIRLFEESGCLPHGVHTASLDEIEARFGCTFELRRVQMVSIRWMVDLARRSGVQRIILNGSFVTDIMESNDVNCVLLIGRGSPVDPGVEAELNDGLPFLEMKLVGKPDFDDYMNETIGTDRKGVPKGMIEVIHEP